MPPPIADFRPEPSSLAALRAFIRDSCPGLDDFDLLKLIILTNELATNAVTHAKTSYQVTLITLEDAVRVEVRDGAESPPRLRRPDMFDTGGRGLVIVDQMARSWGTDVVADGGKVVWAELDTPSLRA